MPINEISKKEERQRAAIIIISLLLFGALSTYFIFSGELKPIGLAYKVQSAQEVGQQLEALIQSLPFTVNPGDGVRTCIIIPTDEETTISFDVQKLIDTFQVVRTADRFCDGPENEDIIIKYSSYDGLMGHYFNPVCSNLLLSYGSSYTFLPSRLVQEGGKVQCTEEFKEKYCAAVSQCIPSEKGVTLGLECCYTADQLSQPAPLPEDETPTQTTQDIAEAEETAEAGPKTGQAASVETTNEEEPAEEEGGSSEGGSTIILVIIAMGVIVVGMASTVAMKRKKQKPKAATQQKEQASMPQPFTSSIDSREDEYKPPEKHVEIPSYTMPRIHPGFGISIVPHRPIYMRRMAHHHHLDPALVKLREYIKTNLEKGVSKEHLEKELLRSGWRKDVIDRFMPQQRL